MHRSMHRTLDHRGSAVLRSAAVTLGALLLIGAAHSAARGGTLDELGRRLEAARAGQDDPVTLAAAWRTVMDAGVEKDLRAAAHLLGAEIALLEGDPERAREQAHRARKTDLDDRDDAEFLEVVALEHEGLEAEAAEAWEHWLDDHEESPLRPEAELRLFWSLLRRGQVEEAGRLRTRMVEEGRTILEDVRFDEADATWRLLTGDVEGADAVLAEAEDTVRVFALRALVHERSGRPLEAAAAWQQVARRASGTPLGDHAALAKADVFFDSGAHRSAGEEFAVAAAAAVDPYVRDEASLRHAVCVYLDGDVEGAASLLRSVVADAEHVDARARAQFMLGELMLDQERYGDAIVEFNEVLTHYFDHGVAASAQYRVGRALDAQARHSDATGAYQAVVRGYPLEPEAPAAAYLAGAGLLAEGRALEAASYFQIVVDRYTSREDGDGTIVFASPEHRELTEAALCLLTLSYHRAGDLGQLSGAPHLMLQRMPPSDSPWRAWALLLDADGLAAMGRHEEARVQLDRLSADFPDHPVMAPATQLLAWSYAETGESDLALQTEQLLLERHAEFADAAQLAQARLHAAHAHFNQHAYEDAASGYEEVLADPANPQREVALHQLALCYQRLGRSGDAVDRWATLVQEAPASELAETAWMRAGDVFFDAGHYEKAERFYRGLLENFSSSVSAPAAQLRLAQAAYNVGDDARAVELYSELVDRFPTSSEAAAAEEGIQTALFRLGDAEGGTEALASLIERFPNGDFAAQAQLRIAESLLEEGRAAEAAEEFRRVVSRFPDDAAADHAQYMVGDAWLQAGEPGRARSAFEQFLTFFPDSELQRTAQFQLGSLFFADEELLRAAVQFTEVLRSEVEDELRSAAWFNLALCEQGLGRVQEAIERFHGYRQAYGDDERAFDLALQLGALHAEDGRVDAAVAEFERARSYPAGEERNGELLYRIAETRELAGDLEGALAAYRKASRNGAPDDGYRLAAVGRVAALLETREDWSGALEAWRDLARNSSDSELATAAAERAAQLEPFAR